MGASKAQELPWKLTVHYRPCDVTGEGGGGGGGGGGGEGIGGGGDMGRGLHSFTFKLNLGRF
jgi:hypothetical protein